MVGSFGVDFSFPVHFTRDVFSASNTTLRDTINRLETDRVHRLLFVIDENVIVADPEIISRIRSYVSAHCQSLELSSDPATVPGGELCKTGLEQVLHLVEQVNDLGIDRQSFLVVVGGGASWTWPVSPGLSRIAVSG